MQRSGVTGCRLRIRVYGLYETRSKFRGLGGLGFRDKDTQVGGGAVYSLLGLIEARWPSQERVPGTLCWVGTAGALRRVVDSACTCGIVLLKEISKVS